MSSIVNFTYDQKGIEDIRLWNYGSNWPIVYIIYNDSKAYVGETLDAVRRTEQHMLEPEFKEFSSICLISNKTFNKSVVLDLESFLIKYMSADGSRELTNGNAGVVDHNYFYKEAYSEDFKEVWKELKERGIVQKSLLDIENSELFKYSPYKTLNSEQQKVAYEILKRLYQINDASQKSIITVTGGAGTGKTILAVYLIKLLVDISANKRIWNAIEDSEDALFVQKMSKDLTGIKKIGFVVPMGELRGTMKNVFRTIEGLDEAMVLAPEDIVKKRFDILVVDEAHRLYKRKNLPGSIVNKFDSINQELMGDLCTKSESDLTELDWIIRSSRMQILFYDQFQAIRVTDIGQERFEKICKPHLFEYVKLFSQMRCKGGNGYYDYVRDVIEKTNMDIHDYIKIPNYELGVVDKVEDLFSIIHGKATMDTLCKVITGPGWSMGEKILIDGHEYFWANGKDDRRENAIFSIHKIQGFDLNYAGVIFGKEIFYDETANCISVQKKEVKDNRTKSTGEESMRRYILNIYITLMTRGINGTFVYAVDPKLREYLKQFWK